MKLLAISGSARAASTNTALLQALAKVSPQDVEIEVVHNLHLLPVFSPDLEGDKAPPKVRDFIAKIEQTDGVIISSPEYVHAIPGGLKNAIDWLVSGEAIIDKPVALIHASHRGDDMLASLRLVLETVTSGFHKQIFQQFSLISMSPDEVQETLGRSENADLMRAFIAEFTDAISKPLSQ